MRKRKLTKVVAAALSFSLCLGTFAGCKKKDDKESKGKSDVYSVMQDTKDLKNGTFEMKLGVGAPDKDEKMELILSGVTTEDSFDMEVAFNIDIPEWKINDTLTRVVYDDEHLYVNVADAMDFVNNISYVGELSDFGIDAKYVDLYVGDLLEQTEDVAAKEMADLLVDVMKDAAVATDKKEGAGKDGSVEFKDEEVLTFIGKFAESFKENADEFVELTVESTMATADYNYDAIIDYYADILGEYGVSAEDMKTALGQVETVEITDADKEMMIEEIETACDDIVENLEEEELDAKGSKLLIEASVDGKKGSKTYEWNIDFLADSSVDDEQVCFYLNYTFKEGEESVKAPSDSIDVKGILEIVESFAGTMNPDVTDPDVEPDVTDPAADPNGEDAVAQNDDGSYVLECEDDDCEYSGRAYYTPVTGYTLSYDSSRKDFHVYNNEEYDSLYLSVYDGEDCLDSYYYEKLSGNAPEGVISSPLGEMTYLIDMQDGYATIYGLVMIDAGHYLEMEYTEFDDAKVNEASLVEILTNFAQGLKAAQ